MLEAIVRLVIIPGSLLILTVVTVVGLREFWRWYNAPLPKRRGDRITPEQARASILSLVEQRAPVLKDVQRLRQKSVTAPSEKVFRYLKEAEHLLSNYNDRINHYEQFLGPVEFLKLQKEMESITHE